MIFALALGCTGNDTPTDDRPPVTTDDDPTDQTTTPPTDDDPTIDTSSSTTGVTGVTGDTGPGIDCSVLPPIPVQYQTLNQFDTSEDFDLDGDGYLCSIDSGNLACQDLYGNRKLVSPNVSGSTAGTRILPTGDWVVNDVQRGAVVRIDGLTGAQVQIATGLQYPNGLEVDRDSMVYVAENSGARARQIDAYTMESWPIATGLLQPNGVILSPDGNTLYIGSFGGGIIYAIDRLGPHEWDEERILYNPAGPDGGFDGINVDACGNVYITEYTVGRVYRITPDGLNAELVVDLQAGWIPNMRWGHDIGGWNSSILYVTAWDRVYALDMQIPGKKHVLMP
ncbi:MAG: SMP-30/gluconolactonase/LRE family protein [Myxococcota bacterium]